MVSNQPVPGAVMTVYQGTSFTPELTPAGYALFRAGVKVSAGTCDDLAASLRRRHQRNGTRWRLLDPLAQAVLVIAFLRTNLTYAELAAGFGISPATCWRDVAEGISVLADRGRRISLRDVARLAVRMGWGYLIVDGTHVPAVTFGRETGGQRAFYSREHKRPGGAGERGLGLPRRRGHARARRDVREENRRPAGLLLREAQAARAERADRVL